MIHIQVVAPPSGGIPSPIVRRATPLLRPDPDPKPVLPIAEPTVIATANSPVVDVDMATPMDVKPDTSMPLSESSDEDEIRKVRPGLVMHHRIISSSDSSEDENVRIAPADFKWSTVSRAGLKDAGLCKRVNPDSDHFIEFDKNLEQDGGVSSAAYRRNIISHAARLHHYVQRTYMKPHPKEADVDALADSKKKK